MDSINLIDFKEILLAGDIKYLRFVEKNSNRLFLIEDCIDISLEDKIDDLNKLNTIDEVKHYFLSRDNNTNIFEFIFAKDIKYHLNDISAMNEDDKKKLTAIIKEVKNLNINYINFTYFFIETKDGKLYFSYLSKKTNSAILKNLKIEKVIKPADISIIMRDIKAYGAFKYHDRTIKYSDIKTFIDNPLLKPDKELESIIRRIRNEESKSRVSQITKKTISDENKISLKKENLVTDEKPKPKKIENNAKEEKQTIKTTKEKKQNTKFKDSIFMYCIIGFTAGVILAAITIVIGSFV